MKILTWNIYMLPLLVPRFSRMPRSRGIAAELQQTDFDIIVFQEAFLPLSRSIIYKELRHIYPHQYGPANNGWHIKSSSGLWVLSKIPLTQVGSIRFNENKDWDRLVKKGALLLEGMLNGKTFQLLNTHLQASHYPDVRRHQLKQIKKQLLVPFGKKDVPQFICGDLNIPSSNATDHNDMLQILKAKDGPLSGAHKYTYDGHDNELAMSSSPRQQTLDYVLVRDNGCAMPPVKRHISILKHEGKELSDHYGLVAEIDL